VAAEELGIAILAYGGGAQHRELVEALLAEGVPASALTIVHNPAEPGEAAAEAPAGCEVIQAERNLGYAGGMNLGIERLRERGVDLLLLLTHDARLRQGALATLLAAARQRPDYGVLGPALVLAGTETPFSFGGITRRTGTNAHVRARPAAVEDGVHGCDWVDGGTLLVRSEVLERTGGFDERFWGYCEEADLCLRVRRSGASVGVVVDAVADQAPGGAKRPGAWAYLLTRNGTEYARRAVGARGVLAMTAREARLAGLEMARALARRLGLRAGEAAEPLAVAVGTVRGLLDYFRGRWGPPPADLPGMGDLHNA
jgi:N-acetylglucosaminyl-diphospho-decaprenol L-rhamnosyltransferase